LATQFCVAGRSRNAVPTATRQPRATRTPAPTNVPRPTRTPAPAAARATDGGAPTSGRATSSSRDEGPGDGATVAGVFGATGQPLGGASSPGSDTTGSDRSTEAVTVAEWAGVRILGPLQWYFEADGVVVRGVVHNANDTRQTVLVVLQLADDGGNRMDLMPFLVAELNPNENRIMVHPLPPGTGPPSEIRARLEPLVP
jgi:hypothetical protein